MGGKTNYLLVHSHFFSLLTDCLDLFAARQNKYSLEKNIPYWKFLHVRNLSIPSGKTRSWRKKIGAIQEPQAGRKKQQLHWRKTLACCSSLAEKPQVKYAVSKQWTKISLRWFLNVSTSLSICVSYLSSSLFQFLPFSLYVWRPLSRSFSVSLQIIGEGIKLERPKPWGTKKLERRCDRGNIEHSLSLPRDPGQRRL